ncbi:MAG TPA: phosphatase PAP2 family protein [Longimicrobiaceae bacterium]|nr:phosphatase PAP2 family protein [Longimicrobiaceae bacterium]
MSRRRLAAALALLLGLTACDSPTEPGLRADRAGGTWRTWVLEGGSALRPPPPPAEGSDEARRELEEIVRLQASLSPAAEAEIARWDGLPTRAWTLRSFDLLEFYWPLLPSIRTATPVRASRIMALLHVAMYDALVATWDAKYAYHRRAPFEADGRVRARVARPGVPSYPSEHAAAAAAAAEVLAYAFPGEDTAAFRAEARRAGESRILAGVARRSDVEAGAALGRAVAQRVLARAMQDGSAAPWTGAVPVGNGMWQPTPPRRVQSPFDPTAGSWRTWVLPRGDVFRPAPHPAVGSPEFGRDLRELRDLGHTRTVRQADTARRWATDAPSTGWNLFVEEEVARRGMTPLREARAHALVSVAMYDAFVACWDAKFHYWLARPVTLAPEIPTVFATPPFPSYPSGHSTISSAAAEVLAELFPDAAGHYRERAEEASLSRVWAGVHYRFDVLAGEELGRRVGRAVVEHARRDGARGTR